MKQALNEVRKIKAYKSALEGTESQSLKNDYNKAIKRSMKELKEYCVYKNISFQELVKKYLS